MTRHSERIGRLGEFAVASWLSEYTDLVNLIPHGSHADIIFEYDKDLYKCQVKTVTKEKKYVSKYTGRHYRSGWCWDLRRGANTRDRDYYDQIDIYALYCKEVNKIFWISAKNLKKTKHTLTAKALQDINSYETWIDACEQTKKFIKANILKKN